MKKHIASVSFGKDSLAMLLLIIEKGLPLDEVVFYDTGMEFQAIYNIRYEVQKILIDKGIEYHEIRPQSSFVYDMTERPVESKEKGKHNGYGWCGGRCRWGTTRKIDALEKYSQNAIQYVGIAADETHRKQMPGKRYPLIEYGMTEAECLQYCRDRGFAWLEKSEAAPGGLVDLYDILDRVSCWCCANKNRKELKNIYIYLPQYWERLKKLQEKIERPMKRFCNKKYGEYGNIFELEEVFKKELGCENEQSVIK